MPNDNHDARGKFSSGGSGASKLIGRGKKSGGKAILGGKLSGSLDEHVSDLAAKNGFRMSEVTGQTVNAKGGKISTVILPEGRANADKRTAFMEAVKQHPGFDKAEISMHGEGMHAQTYLHLHEKSGGASELIGKAEKIGSGKRPDKPRMMDKAASRDSKNTFSGKSANQVGRESFSAKVPERKAGAPSMFNRITGIGMSHYKAK